MWSKAKSDGVRKQKFNFQELLFVFVFLFFIIIFFRTALGIILALFYPDAFQVLVVDDPVVFEVHCSHTGTLT